MTKEEKQLLVKDLCGRLLYWPRVKTIDKDRGYIIGIDNTEEGVFHVHILEDGDSYTCDMPIENFKPYLRPISSMTEEEDEELKYVIELELQALASEGGHNTAHAAPAAFEIDFYNRHHFDYRGLIPMDLALEALEGMYKEE